MAPSALSALVAVASASYVVAQQTLSFPATPLNQLSFPHQTDAPYQIYPASQPYVRGPQTGYNICNSTTEGDNSMCQTMHVNGLDDFCLWGPPEANSTIADTEGEEVAWCTKPGSGTRIMREGTFKGLQLLKTPQYWMITGLIDQTLLNIQEGDFGGELDSGGQDERGNPIGGLLYSTAFATDSQADQVQWWTEFIGSNQVCIKICNPTGNESGYCQHTLDRIGLAYNCPSKYTIGGGAPAGEFEVCDSDLMTVPGVYVDNGVTSSYAQPPESLGPITSIPYSPSLVASSNCVTTASSALFSQLVAAPSSAGASTTGSAGASATGSAGASASGNKASTSGSRTGSAGGAAPTGGSSLTGGAGALRTSAFATVAGVIFAVAFFA